MKSRVLFQASAIAACCALPMSSFATNGYFLPGFGVKSQGAGGVGIALQADSLSHVANPANATETGTRGDLGLTLFYPDRWAATGAATGVPPDPNGAVGGFPFNRASQSAVEAYLMPDMAYITSLGNNLAAGIAMVGNGGMNTTFKQNIFGFGAFQNGGPNDKTGVDLMQLLIPVTLAYKASPEHSFGASLTLAAQRFRAYGLGRFVQFGISSDSAHLTNQGDDWSMGAGVRLGWLGKFMDDKVSLGATWASKTYMTRFKKYQGLFAEQGDFDIPENFGLGLAIKPTKNLTTAFDIVRIKYSGVASVANPGPGIYGGSGVDENEILNVIANAGGNSTDPRALGMDNGMGFGWKDMTVYKLGVIYDATDRLTVRGGLNYGKMPIREDQAVFSALAPAVVERHISVGFTYKMQGKKDWELSGFYMYVPEEKVAVNAQAVVDQVSYKMSQRMIGVGFGSKF